MKTLLYTFCLYLLLGCEKFVNVDLPDDQLTKEVVFKNDQLALAAMAGVYRSLDSSGFLSGSSQGGGLLLGCYTDELISYQSQSSGITQFYQLGITPQSTIIKNLWEVAYNQIYMLNSILEGMGNSKGVSESVKKQLRGEALFIRGLLHASLTNTFGDIPYIKSTDYNLNLKVHKNRSEEVLDLAINDIKDALSLLPANAPKGQRIRPTKIAANVMLARLSLYQKKWTEAQIYASEVLKDSTYSMESDLQKVFLKDGSSIIWQLQATTSQSNANEGLSYIFTTAPPSLVSLTPDLVNSFDEKDLRRKNWVGELKDSQQRSYYYAFKYKQRTTTTSSMEYSVILRMEEVLLIRAEAFLHLEQNDKALIDLNSIRKRAGLPDIVMSNSIDISSEIINERRHEFFVEAGHRFFDLKRSQRLDAVMKNVKPQWKSYFLLLPLPESELLLNINLNPQNSGYQ